MNIQALFKKQDHATIATLPLSSTLPHAILQSDGHFLDQLVPLLKVDHPSSSDCFMLLLSSIVSDSIKNTALLQLFPFLVLDLDLLFTSVWPIHFVAPLVAVSIDLDLTNHLATLLVNKVLSYLASCPDFDVLCYQLLILAHKYKHSQPSIINGICLLFENNLSLSRGNAISHIQTAAKQDSNIALEIIKQAKSTLSSPFRLSLLLSISRIYRYQDSIYSFIKNLIIDGYKNIDRVKYIKWIDTSQISDLASPDLFIQSITQVIATNSQHISEGILAIGFILLDSEKIVAGRSCNDSLPYQSTKRVGFNILLQLYDSLPLCRCAIVDGLIDRIESRNGSMSLEILLDISTRDNFYQDHFNKVKNLLTYLTEIGLDSSKQILLILSPHIDSTLQNLLLLQFRKNIFSRILENRTVALYGYQFLLNHDSTSLETRREITLIICNLLNHHETLNEIYLVFNSISVPELIDQVFESLIAHLKKYIDNGLITVSSSVSETDATITNHLYNLIETVCKLARISKCPEKLSAIEKICKQFANSTVFAHGFDMADSDFSSSSLIGKINLRRVQLIQGIIFKFVEHCLSIKKLDLVHSLIVLNLAFEKASKDKDKWELKGVSFDVCCDWIYNGELKEDSMTRFIALNLLEAIYIEDGYPDNNLTKLASVLYPKFLVGAFGKDATNQKKKLVVSCKSIFIQVFSVIVSILAKKNLPSESHDALYKLHRESDPTTTIRMIISKIEVFYEAKKFKEAGYMFNSLFSIVEYHQDAPDYIFDWLKQFLIDPPPGTHETDGDQIIAKKSMLLLSLLVHDPKNDFKLIGEIIVFMSTFSEIVGSQPTEQSSQDDTFELVNETTADVICSTLLNSMYGFYDDLEYIINLLLKSRKNDGTDGTDFKVYESKLYQQTTLLVYSLSKFERIHLKQATSDLRLKVVGKAYKTLTQLVKYKMIDSKPVISEEFADTLSHCHEMTQLLYVMLPFVTEKPESKKRKTDKVVVGRDTKLVPSVVFQVETFERYLIELSKKAEFDLEKFIRRSTARDFKIDLRGYHGGDDEDEKEKAENEEPKKKDKKKKK